MNSTDCVLHEIARERESQDARWGEQNHPNFAEDHDFELMGWVANMVKRQCDRAAEVGKLSWANILFEEVAEALSEDNEDFLRAELVQVAAVAAAWVECIDRRRVANG